MKGIEDTFKKGLSCVFDNPELVVFPILRIFFIVFLLIGFGLSLLVLAGLSMIYPAAVVAGFFILVSVFIAVTCFFTAFFTSSLIGGINDVIDGKRAELSAMVKFGLERFADLFAVNICYYIIVMLLLFSFAPSVILDKMGHRGAAVSAGAFAFAFSWLCAVIMGFALMPLTYVTVLNYMPFNMYFVKSFDYFKNNLSLVLLIWSFTIFTGVAAQVPFSLLTGPLSFLNLFIAGFGSILSGTVKVVAVFFVTIYVEVASTYWWVATMRRH